MPISFREQDKIYWDWLPDDLSERLDIIRERVCQIHDRCKPFPQLRWFTPHGEDHYLAVEDLIHRLLPKERHKQLTEMEKFFLLGSAWLHDLGMIKGIFPDDRLCDDYDIRDHHHTRSEKFIVNKAVGKK